MSATKMGRRRAGGWLALAGLALAACAEVPPLPAPVGPSTPPPTASAASSVAPVRPERVQLVGPAMGTKVTLAAHTTADRDAAEIRTALAAGYQEILRIEALMTPHRSDSELGRINVGAGGPPVAVGEETRFVLAKSLWIAERSQGVFDVTFASMGKLWSFGGGVPAIPDAKTLEQARRRIDYRKIALDEQAGTVQLLDPDTRVDLGGIAKGYAVDQAAHILRQRGLRSFIVQAGGDLYVAGRKPTGRPWRVGVRDPRGRSGSFFAFVSVEDHAFSTAGDYERGFVHDGKRYHHIIDPRSGYPATECRSVSVWARDALTADAIDDAVFILGPQEGLKLVDSIDDCGVVIVTAANEVLVSSRLEGHVQVTRQPTDGI